MSQTVRPDSDITLTDMDPDSTYSAINETTPNDLARVITNLLSSKHSTAQYECGLGTPANGTPGAGTSTISYRGCRSINDRSVQVTVSVYEGATLRAAGTQVTLPYNASFDTNGTWTTFSFTADLSAVTDWSNLSLRFDFDSSGGGIGALSQGAISYAAVAVPDPATSAMMMILAGV